MQYCDTKGFNRDSFALHHPDLRPMFKRLAIALTFISLLNPLLAQNSPFGSGSKTINGSRSSEDSIFRKTPFGSTERSESSQTKEIDFDVSKVGQLGRIETREKFQKIWMQFLVEYGLDSDGDFIQGSGTSPPTSDAYAQNAFIYFVSSQRPTIVLKSVQVCPACTRGKKPGYVDGMVGEVACDKCRGSWEIKLTERFNLFYSATLPPKTPWPAAKGKSKREANGTSPGTSPKAESTKTNNLEEELKSVVQKHLDEILQTKITGSVPKGFGATKVSFSAPKGVWQINLEFQNNDQIKVEGARVMISLIDTNAMPGTDDFIVGKATLSLSMASSNACSADFSSFSFTTLKSPSGNPSKTDMMADYAFVLKEIKRANAIFVQIFSVTPAEAQRALDIEPRSAWQITRPAPPTPVATAPQPAASPAAPRTEPPVVAQQPERPRSFGSGMVFTNEGHIFTNHHVIAKAENIFVVVYENGQITKKFPATVINKDPRSDLAILQCKEWKPATDAPKGPPPVVPSNQCKLGAQVFVLGYPLPGTVSSNVKYTKGDVSDMAGLDDDSSKIQHTAQIQPGNSGGPMALTDGRVVGIIVSSLSESFALRTSGSLPQGVNFSIKSDYLLTLASIAGIDIPKTKPSSEPIEHVKAYTVQIMCEK
jgi:S1-C subfamily serine protease